VYRPVRKHTLLLWPRFRLLGLELQVGLLRVHTTLLARYRRTFFRREAGKPSGTAKPWQGRGPFGHYLPVRRRGAPPNGSSDTLFWRAVGLFGGGFPPIKNPLFIGVFSAFAIFATTKVVKHRDMPAPQVPPVWTIGPSTEKPEEKFRSVMALIAVIPSYVVRQRYNVPKDSIFTILTTAAYCALKPRVRKPWRSRYGNRCR
jgi:hypothetical protein